MHAKQLKQHTVDCIGIASELNEVLPCGNLVNDMVKQLTLVITLILQVDVNFHYLDISSLDSKSQQKVSLQLYMHIVR